MLSHDYSCLAVQGAQREAAATAERLDLAEGRCRSRVRVGPELGQGCARVPCHPGGAAAHCPGLCVAGSLGAWPRCALGTNPRAAQGYSGRLAAPAVRPRPTSPIPRRCTRSCSKMMLLLEAAHAASTAGASQLSVARTELRGLDGQSAVLHERAVGAEA